MSSKVNTIKGPLPPAELGVTLTHEHILIDQSFLTGSNLPKEESNMRHIDEPVNLENLWVLKRDPYLCRDNTVIQDVEIAAKELKYFAERGGKTVVDVTNIGMGRSPEGLKRVSEASWLNIVTSTGFYVEQGHPAFVQESSVEDMSNVMVENPARLLAF